MERLDDLVARWPQFDLARRVAHLRRTFRSSHGAGFLKAADVDRATRAADGLRRRDPATWSSDPAVQQKIANRLGWLTSPELMASSIDRLTSFADGIRRHGFTDVVLLGMGGSSLAPEVLRAVIGSAPGFPTLHVLDSTDPAAVRAIETPPLQTLYLLASKSGTTIEPNSLAAHFRARLEAAAVAQWAEHFVAITDEGTELHRRAQTERFRDVFVNPSDIGGRYSALSFFGLVPAAIMGQDVASLIAWGLAMLVAADDADVRANPAVLPGLLMGAGAQAGRDKLTLIVPPSLEPFGLWVEQLVAESTGKNGVGVVPIVGERVPLSEIDRPDRIFAAIVEKDAPDLKVGPTDRVGTEAPIFTVELPEPDALGAEFVRWEIATAVAGAILGINPFDEPNVQSAKDATGALLGRYRTEGRLPAATADRRDPDGTTRTLSRSAREVLSSHPDRFLSLLQQGDYFALLAYLGPDPELLEPLQTLRLAVSARTGLATTLGYGPRYLHSTGQLHKGGANNGVFVLVTATPAVDVPVPGQAYSFGTLELAQALGDFASLDATGRRALHIHLPAPDPRALRAALTSLLV